MTLAVVRSRAIDGLDAPAVLVEVHLANGLPSFTLVGLADTEVKEARERVRAALAHSGLGFPNNKRITVNLAPADLPKESGRFDLPIALGILAAAGQIDAQALDGYEFAGELSLAGELRPVRGALALALAVRHEGAARTLVLPARAPARRRWPTASTCAAPRHLLDVVAALQPGDAAQPLAVGARAAGRRRKLDALDLRDVRGQAGAKRALEIAAAGGHSLLMVGPPGTGKSMLAQRLPGLLPPMTENEALASAAIASLAGALRPRALDGAPVPRAAPLGHRRGAGRRRFAAAAGRDLAGLRRRALSRRDARVATRRARGPARAARNRPHHDLARRAPGLVPGTLSADRGDEPLPLRLPRRLRRHRAALPLHARRGGALPGARCRGRCSTASTCRSKCRRSSPPS